MLDDELAVPRASDRVLCDSLQFQMWQVLMQTIRRVSITGSALMRR